MKVFQKWQCTKHFSQGIITLESLFNEVVGGEVSFEAAVLTAGSFRVGLNRLCQTLKVAVFSIFWSTHTNV